MVKKKSEGARIERGVRNPLSLRLYRGTSTNFDGDSPAAESLQYVHPVHKPRRRGGRMIGAHHVFASSLPLQLLSDVLND